VEIVSRDRSSEYAAAISKGAPQALQVADLWHIVKNLSESVQTLLARCRAEIRRGSQTQATPEQEPAETEPVLEEERRPARSLSVKLAQVGRRAQKLDRYEQVVELHQQGVKAADIASRVGIGERTVHRWLAHGSFPEARRRRRRPSLIDPYERYVFQWWQEGHRNGSQLYRELKAQGYKGSSKAMYNYLATLRAPRSNSSKSSPLKSQEPKSVPLPTGYATSEPRGGESPENLAKTAERWLPERKLSLCRCWKEWKQGVSYGTVILRWEKEGCYRIPFKEQAPQTYPLLGTML
jgi:transposase